MKLTIEDITPEQLADIASVLQGKPVIDLDRPGPQPLSDEEKAALVKQHEHTVDQSGNTTEAQTTDDSPPPPPAGVDLAKGLCGEMIPWDARIHAGSKKINADGSWKLIKGADRENFVPTVETELLQAMVAPAPTATQTEASAASVTQPASGNDDPPPPPAGESAAPTTFAELLPLVTKAKTAGTLTDERISEVCAELGLASFGLVATRPDLIPAMAEQLGV